MITKSKLLSSYAVMITGTTSPARSFVASLNAVQNCGMLIPAEASAGPGLAPPAGTEVYKLLQLSYSQDIPPIFKKSYAVVRMKGCLLLPRMKIPRNRGT